MAYLLKFLDIFRWKKHYGREWGIQKIFMDLIKERMNRIMSKVYIFFADGFEDIEGLTVVDLMRRAGIDIQTVSIKETKEIRTSHGIDLLTDRTFGECDFSDADMLVIPGGMPGTKYLEEYKPLTELLTDFYQNGGKVAAICAAHGYIRETWIPERQKGYIVPICYGTARKCQNISGACSGGWECNYQQRPWNSHRFQPFPDRTAGGKRKGRRDR